MGVDNRMILEFRACSYSAATITANRTFRYFAGALPGGQRIFPLAAAASMPAETAAADGRPQGRP